MHSSIAPIISQPIRFQASPHLPSSRLLSQLHQTHSPPSLRIKSPQQSFLPHLAKKSKSHYAPSGLLRRTGMILVAGGAEELLLLAEQLLFRELALLQLAGFLLARLCVGAWGVRLAGFLL